jgi:hypothetical protein
VASATDVLLAWARDRDGRRVHVSALHPRRREERAPFACLGCGEPLVARLGPRRARHFAHRPGSTCALTRPETALHLDGKERLLALCGEAFAGRLQVALHARCPRCRRVTPLAVAEAADGAEAERAVGEVRPDVVLTQGGHPALVLEVRVTHAVDPTKEAALSALALPALEIDAREPWEDRTGDRVAIRVARSLGTSPCASCQALSRAGEGRAQGGEAAELAELEAYRARGLLGSRPGPALDVSTPLSEADRDAIGRGFACPECGERGLLFGERVVRHRCRGALRPVAWRGYDGALVELGWWRRR